MYVTVKKFSNPSLCITFKYTYLNSITVKISPSRRILGILGIFGPFAAFSAILFCHSFRGHNALKKQEFSKTSKNERKKISTDTVVKSNAKEHKATGGFVSNLPHPRVMRQSNTPTEYSD